MLMHLHHVTEVHSNGWDMGWQEGRQTPRDRQVGLSGERKVGVRSKPPPVGGQCPQLRLIK